jgi:hypothetical protein
MTIKISSRYAQGEQMWVTTTGAHGRGNKQVVYLNTVIVLNSPYIAALVRETDNISLYAWRAYQDPKRWWVIADANPRAFYPLDLIPGQSLRVPQ